VNKPFVPIFAAIRWKCLSMKCLHATLSFPGQGQSSLIKANQSYSLKQIMGREFVADGNLGPEMAVVSGKNPASADLKGDFAAKVDCGFGAGRAEWAHDEICADQSGIVPAEPGQFEEVAAAQFAGGRQCQ
jgi:hypothetical protein